MRNYILIMTLFLGAVFAGCEKEWVKPNNLVDVNFYTSQFTKTKFNIGINDFISFSDLSQGTLTHKWTITEGAFFLQEPITRQDSVYDKFKLPGLETEQKTIHVLFTKGGLQPVRLYDTFPDSVAYRSLKPYPAKKQGNVWVIDTTFMVDVYDKIIPAYKITQNGLTVPATKDTIYIEAGSSLTFIVMTVNGRPNTRLWDVAGLTGKDSVSTLLFKKLGTFTGYFTASRSGQNIPGDSKRVIISSVFKVIPSTKPFIQLGTIMEQDNETIQIPFNGEFVPFLNQESFFTVKVNGIKFPIKTLTINTKDATILDLTLVDKIFRPDVITISYTGGLLKSTDTRSLVPFTDVPVTMSDINLLPVASYGFENGGISWIPTWDNKGIVSFTQEKAASGLYSLKIVTTSLNLNGKAESSKAKFTLVKGQKYILRYKVWIDPSSTTIKSVSTWFIDDWTQYWEDFSGKQKGQWVTIERIITYNGNGNPQYLEVRVNNDTVGTVYFDDFYIATYEVRL